MSWWSKLKLKIELDKLRAIRKKIKEIKKKK